MSMNVTDEEKGRLERNHYDSVDQMSGLPKFIIHHIMSFLPTKDVARISLLSKKWKGLRASFPILDFDQEHCTNNVLRFISPESLKKEKVSKEAWSAWMEFRRYVNATVLEFYETRYRMKKFKLSITFPDLKMTSVVDKWLGMALESGVQEVDLELRTPKSKTFNWDELYILPESIFAARFITNLSLRNCYVQLKQEPFFKDIVRFHCLQKLSLEDVYIDDALFHQIISSCHLIENISLVCCGGINFFHVFGLIKLKEVEVRLRSDELKRIDIETSSLQSFRYKSLQRETPCVVNVDMCRDLKNLTIQVCSTSTEQLVNDLSSKFPYLENLWLGVFVEIKRLKISSHTIRKLSLYASSKLMDVEIDTPNLLHFHYASSNVLPTFINAPCPWEVNIDVTNNVDSLWLMKLKEFLSKSNQIVYLNMNISPNEHTFNLEDLVEMSLPQNLGVEDLILRVESCVPNSAAALLDGLLWCFHPKIISVSPAIPRNEKFIEFLSQEFVKRDASCCNFRHTKCWRHFLKDTKIVNFDAGLPDEERFHCKATIYATPVFKLNLCRYILEW